MRFVFEVHACPATSEAVTADMKEMVSYPGVNGTTASCSESRNDLLFVTDFRSGPYLFQDFCEIQRDFLTCGMIGVEAQAIRGGRPNSEGSEGCGKRDCFESVR